MTAVILDKSLERQIIARRRRMGVDGLDEVWDGVDVMAPAADIEHQDVSADLVELLRNVVRSAGLGECFPAVNISDRRTGWKKNFRCPDAAVFLKDNPAEDRGTFWFGGPAFAVEIVSPNDRSRKKIPFYEKVATRELLIVDRKPWQLLIFRLSGGILQKVGESTPAATLPLVSEVLPLSFQLVESNSRPAILVKHLQSDRQWTVEARKSRT
jgi:Uma2 family endonuclease